MQRVWVWSLVRELRTHMPHSQNIQTLKKKKKKKCKQYVKILNKYFNLNKQNKNQGWLLSGPLKEPRSRRGCCNLPLHWRPFRHCERKDMKRTSCSCAAKDCLAPGVSEQTGNGPWWSFCQPCNIQWVHIYWAPTMCQVLVKAQPLPAPKVLCAD